MAIPPFLATPFRYFERAAVVDVATIITDSRTELLAGGWTEPVANTFQSPADAAGRFFRLVFTRLSATRLELLVQDQNSATVSDRAADIDVTGNTVQIYTGSAHYYMNSERATPEILRGGLTDFTPENQTVSSTYVWGGGHRTAAGAAGLNDWVSLFIANVQASRGIVYQDALGAIRFITVSAVFLFLPFHYFYSVLNDTHGRIYQTIVVDESIPFSAEIECPIDAGVNATFKVVGAVINSHAKIAVRKS